MKWDDRLAKLSGEEGVVVQQDKAERTSESSETGEGKEEEKKRKMNENE